jgi:DNA-directed RNA polymerase specialized sigma24 family protein
MMCSSKRLRSEAESEPSKYYIVGWGADEVCEVLGISATNQRVLLHRARTKVRRAIEKHLAA